MDGDQLDSDSDDVLLRVCGAQQYTMICVRKEQLKKGQVSHFKSTQKELDFLAQISMGDSQKESLPVSLKSTGCGGKPFH